MIIDDLFPDFVVTDFESHLKLVIYRQGHSIYDYLIHASKYGCISPSVTKFGESLSPI